MPTESKKHHFVPQSLLKQFSIEQNERQILVYNKQANKSYISAISNAGIENKFNTIETKRGKFNLEFLFDKIDAVYSQTIKKIINAGSLKTLKTNDFYFLSFVVLNQYLRTKRSRFNIAEIDKKVAETLEKVSGDMNLISEYQELSDDEIKLISIINSCALNGGLEHLLDKGIYLIKNCTSTPFIISDNPVVTHNGFPYGENGLASEGIEIYMPINPNLMIGYCCKSIIYKFQTALEHDIIEEFAVKLLEAVNSNNPLEISHIDTINFYNELQIVNSHRFIYNSIDDFSLVREILDRSPKLKEVQSNIVFGELGKGPPINKKLPKGDLLIIHGSIDHNLLPIILLEHSRSGIRFRTNDKSILFQLILKNVPYKRIELCTDQKIIRIMGDPIINLIDNEKRIYEVIHSDPRLTNIIEGLSKK